MTPPGDAVPTSDASASERVEVVPLAHGVAAVYCVRSPYKTVPNEDAAVIVPVDERRTVLAVADGMGGQPAGARASEVALQTLEERVRQGAEAPGGLRPAILDGFETANDRIVTSGTGSGTTLAVLEIDGTTIRPYHVGDSAILVVGQRGRIKLQTVAHSPVGYAVESGFLDEAAAMHHHDRHLVSNFVGTPEMRIDVGAPLELQRRDTVVLASDGLFDNLHMEEIVAFVRKGALRTAANALANACRERMLSPPPGAPSKADDLTFILYRPVPAG